jgi:cysteine desulfurase/selenocysteine lyase
MSFDIEKIRQDFPNLSVEVNRKPLVYLDNAATTMKPKSVIDKIMTFYTEQNSNIHRGVHKLSQIATKEYEDTRKYVKEFINAKSIDEIIFTRGTSESINLVASSYGRKNLQAGDEVIISTMEHHSNIVPWQMICEETGARLKVIPINDDGELLLDEYRKMLNSRTKIVSIVHISNSLGTINPIKDIIDMAHEVGAVVLVDGAQSVQHVSVDVQQLDCDFFAFSGHKAYGPTGIGVLYGKKEILNAMPPYQGGGDMILSVSFEKTIFNELPYKFEAGTPNIAGGIALKTALQYIKEVGLENIAKHEKELLDYATEQVSEIDGFRIIGRAANKASVLSFVLDNVHPHDIGTFLDMDGVAIRTGHHCTEPIMRRFDVPATSRASFAVYNTKEEVDKFVASVKNVIETFR